MAGIIVTFLVAILGLCLLFFFSSRFAGKSGENATVKQTHPPIPGLSAAFLPDLDVLSGKDDYRKLAARRELRSVRKRFWRDRRRIVLMWLAELQRDVHILWEFRRFLVRSGLRVTFREEAGVASAALVALLYLRIVRVSVFVLGPLAALGALSIAKLLVQLLSSRGVALLARVPAPRKAEIEERWAQHLVLLRAE